MKLLTPMISNAKTAKSQLDQYHGALLHLAPANVSGYNTCPAASTGCKAACLNTAGRGGMFKRGESTNAIQQARIRKTVMFFEQRELFMSQLIDDIGLLIEQAYKQNKRPVVRLNGTSDIAWESVLIDGFANLFEYFPTVQFYDYTKLPMRVVGNRWDNYHLTFSQSESNHSIVSKLASQGHNVAVVFRAELPEFYLGRRVIDGDSNGDFRFLDERGVIVGLKAKGPAKRDESGFVVESPSHYTQLLEDTQGTVEWYNVDDIMKQFDGVVE
jgi:hypothetical protein